MRTDRVPSNRHITPFTRKSASEVCNCSKIRIIEERTKVKDSDNQLNNSALSGAEFATFYAKLRQKRVKSPENRKNAKRSKKSRNPKSAETEKAQKGRACGARVCEAVGHSRPPCALGSCGSDAPRSASACAALAPCSRCTRWLPRALVRRLRIGPIVPPEWRARADFSVS